jgi:hypothetical protein
VHLLEIPVAKIAFSQKVHCSYVDVGKSYKLIAEENSIWIVMNV